jgi:hypothetical protein
MGRVEINKEALNNNMNLCPNCAFGSYFEPILNHEKTV